VPNVRSQLLENVYLRWVPNGMSNTLNGIKHAQHSENCGRSLIGSNFIRKDDKPFCKTCPTHQPVKNKKVGNLKHNFRRLATRYLWTMQEIN
jgi:hypothetical protein